MNLTVYNPNEPEDSTIPEAREEVGNIVPFSVTPPDPNYMNIEEVAAILWKTEEKILFGISCGKLPARDIWGEWRIDREAFREIGLLLIIFSRMIPTKKRG